MTTAPIPCGKGPRKDGADGRTLIFLHLPKTAGNTLQTVLTTQYPEDSIYWTAVGRAPHAIEDFAAADESERSKYRLIIGHMFYGIHEKIPHDSTYMTVVREPVDRFISNYYFNLTHDEAPLYGYLNENNIGLEEFVVSNISTDNVQSRRLCGMDGRPRITPIGKCPQSMLDRAMRNLRDNFAVVGLLERFDETLMLIRREFGWNSWPYYQRQNITAGRPKLAGTDPEVMRLIADRNRLDVALYAYARKLFNGHMRRAGLSLRLQAHLFKLVNDLTAKGPARDLAKYTLHHAF